jgi:hypothetical protein
MLIDSIWDYYVDIKVDILVSAFLIMFIAMLLTVGFKVLKAARANLAESLKYE